MNSSQDTIACVITEITSKHKPKCDEIIAKNRSIAFKVKFVSFVRFLFSGSKNAYTDDVKYYTSK